MKTISDSPDRSALIRATQSRQTIDTLKTEIAEAWRAFEYGAHDLMDLALDLENKRIKLGVLLSEAKDQVGHGHFADFVNNSCVFSLRTAQRFMLFARAAGGKLITSLDDHRRYQNLLVEWGIVEAPDGHGPQTLHDVDGGYFAKTVKTLGSARATLDALIESRPLEAWDESERAQLREQLRPIVTIFEGLK